MRKRKPRRVPHQITLVAFERQPDGKICIHDIIETSFRFACHFTRNWYRDAQVYAITACAPGRSLAEGTPREIHR